MDKVNKVSLTDNTNLQKQLMAISIKIKNLSNAKEGLCTLTMTT